MSITDKKRSRRWETRHKLLNFAKQHRLELSIGGVAAVFISESPVNARGKHEVCTIQTVR